jgi:hypothetical protein
MVLRRPGRGGKPLGYSRPGLWRDGIMRKYSNKKNSRRQHVGSSIIDRQFNLSSKSLFYGIVAFMLIIFGYIILEKMIAVHNNPIEVSKVGKSTTAHSLFKNHPPAQQWQHDSQLKSLKILPSTAKEVAKLNNKKPHLISKIIHDVNKEKEKLVKKESELLSDEGSPGKKTNAKSIDNIDRHAWKKEKHPKHKNKIKKKHRKGQPHISPAEYKIMFKKAVIHRLPHGVHPDSERAKLVYDELEAIETRIRKFYEEVNPERIPTIPNIMKKYIFPGDHHSMTKLSERLQEVYGKPAIRKYFVQDTTSHSEEEYGQDQLKAMQSQDLHVKLRLFFKHHDKFRMKDVDSIVGNGNNTITMSRLCKTFLLPTYSIVSIKKFFGLEEDWALYDSEDHEKIARAIALGNYKDDVPTEDAWQHTLKKSEKKLEEKYGKGNFKVDWESTNRSLHEMYLYGKGNIGRPDDPNDIVDQRIHRHDYIHRHFDEAAQKGHERDKIEKRRRIKELANNGECTFWQNVTFSPCFPLHPCQQVSEHTPIFYSKCFDRLGLKYCKKYGFAHSDPGCILMFGSSHHQAIDMMRAARENQRKAKREESIKQKAFDSMYRAPNEEEQRMALENSYVRSPGETNFEVKRIVHRMQKFYKRIGRLSPIAIKKSNNVTNLRRIARLYIDSEDLLFERLRKKYGLKKMFDNSKIRRRLLNLLDHTIYLTNHMLDKHYLDKGLTTRMLAAENTTSKTLDYLLI